MDYGEGKIKTIIHEKGYSAYHNINDICIDSLDVYLQRDKNPSFFDLNVDNSGSGYYAMVIGVMRNIYDEWYFIFNGRISDRNLSNN
mgnify:CR=1 FL=1